MRGFEVDVAGWWIPAEWADGETSPEVDSSAGGAEAEGGMRPSRTRPEVDQGLQGRYDRDGVGGGLQLTRLMTVPWARVEGGPEADCSRRQRLGQSRIGADIEDKARG